MRSLFLHSFGCVIILIISPLYPFPPSLSPTLPSLSPSLSHSLSLSLPLSLPSTLPSPGFAHSPVVIAATLQVGQTLSLHHQQSFPSPPPPPQLRRSSTSRWPNIATARRSFCSCSVRILRDLQRCRLYFQSHGTVLTLPWRLCHSLKTNRLGDIMLWLRMCRWTDGIWTSRVTLIECM